MVDGDVLGTLSSQGECPMSISCRAVEVHVGLVVTATVTLAVAAAATRAGSRYLRARSAWSTRGGSGGHRGDLC
jgi:hypothetical protein